MTNSNLFGFLVGCPKKNQNETLGQKTCRLPLPISGWRNKNKPIFVALAFLLLLLGSNRRSSAQCDVSSTVNLCYNNTNAFPIQLSALSANVLLNYGLLGANYSAIDWYSCTNTAYAGAAYTGQTAISYLGSSVPSAGTYYFFYDAIPNGINPACSSGVYTVHYSICDITPRGSSIALNTQLDVDGNPANFSNYQWYRNGTMIPGATSSSHTATLPGSYTLKMDNLYCVSVESSPAHVGCPTSPTIVFPANTIFSTGPHTFTGDIRLNGDFTVPAGSEITFQNATVEIAGGNCTKGVINPNTSNGNGGKLILDNCILFTCNSQKKWKGLEIFGDVSGTRNVKDGLLESLNSSRLMDADIGVFATDEGYLNLADLTFESNRCHIVLEDNPLTGGCGDNIYSYLMDNGTSICSGNGTSFTSSNAGIDRYIYMENSGGIIMNDCIFRGTKLTANDLYAIETYNCSQILEIGGGAMQDDFDKGIYLENCDAFNIGGMQISGHITTGIHINGGSNHNIWNGNTLSYAGVGSSTTGILLNQSQDDLITTSYIGGYKNGIEIYSNTTSANIKVTECGIGPNTYGIVIAPDCHPVTGGCNNSTNYSVLKDITISCNRILFNDYGIIGVGKMNNQGTSTTDWSNRFCDGSTANDQCHDYSSSFKADVVWWNDFANSAVKGFTVRLDEGNHGNTGLLGTYPRDLKDLGAYTLALDGATISLSGGAGTYKNTDQFHPLPTSGNSCNYYCSSTHFDKMDSNELLSQQNLKTIISPYPNPAFSYVSFTGVESNSHITLYEVFDIMGRLVLKGNTATHPFSIPIEHLNSGVYNVNFNNEYGRVAASRFVKSN